MSNVDQIAEMQKKIDEQLVARKEIKENVDTNGIEKCLSKNELELIKAKSLLMGEKGATQ